MMILMMIDIVVIFQEVAFSAVSMRKLGGMGGWMIHDYLGGGQGGGGGSFVELVA